MCFMAQRMKVLATVKQLVFLFYVVAIGSEFFDVRKVAPFTCPRAPDKTVDLQKQF